MIFIVGLPFSFGIGALIGFLVWIFRIKKNTSIKKKIYILTGGISYILAQPISLVIIAFIPIRNLDNVIGLSIPMDGFTFCEMCFSVLFAFIFTLFILVMKSNKDLKKSLAFYF